MLCVSGLRIQLNHEMVLGGRQATDGMPSCGVRRGSAPPADDESKDIPLPSISSAFALTC